MFCQIFLYIWSLTLDFLDIDDLKLPHEGQCDAFRKFSMSLFAFVIIFMSISKHVLSSALQFVCYEKTSLLPLSFVGRREHNLTIQSHMRPCVWS